MRNWKSSPSAGLVIRLGNLPATRRLRAQVSGRASRPLIRVDEGASVLGAESIKGPLPRPGPPARVCWRPLHEGACRLWRDGVDVRTIQLMLGDCTMMVTQRYLNVTDEEVRQRMPEHWKKPKPLHFVETAATARRAQRHQSDIRSGGERK
jgi:hypothetical protein